MDILEYNKVKDLNYDEYCDYLKKKYGLVRYNYFIDKGGIKLVKNTKITRTKEGLVCHHVCEDKAILLSNPDYALRNPKEYQDAKNLVYCDYLEHLFLHILICEKSFEAISVNQQLGIGGIISFLVPELNDVYSGYITNQNWRYNCHKLILNDKDVYLLLLKRLKKFLPNYQFYNDESLYSSFNAKFNLWDIKRNKNIFQQISEL